MFLFYVCEPLIFSGFFCVCICNKNKCVFNYKILPQIVGNNKIVCIFANVIITHL